MKDMLQFLIARDTMHQQQWLAVIEELGGYEGVLPIPNSHPASAEHREFSYAFISTHVGPDSLVDGRFTHGRSLDGEGEFEVRKAAALADVPQLAPPPPGLGAQEEQMSAEGVLDRVKGAITGR